MNSDVGDGFRVRPRGEHEALPVKPTEDWDPTILKDVQHKVDAEKKDSWPVAGVKFFFAALGKVSSAAHLPAYALLSAAGKLMAACGGMRLRSARRPSRSDGRCDSSSSG